MDFHHEHQAADSTTRFITITPSLANTVNLVPHRQDKTSRLSLPWIYNSAVSERKTTDLIVRRMF